MLLLKASEADKTCVNKHLFSNSVFEMYIHPFTLSFIDSFKKYLLNPFCALSTLQGARDVSANQIDKKFFLSRISHFSEIQLKFQLSKSLILT